MAQLVQDPNFRGTIRVKTHEGRWIAPGKYGRIEIPLLDYEDSPYNWNVEPSPVRGGFFISTPTPNRGFWQADLKNQKKVGTHSGADDWESFHVLPHPSGSGFAFRNVATNQFVCAEPSSHSVRLTAGANVAAEWERFDIQIV